MFFTELLGRPQGDESMQSKPSGSLEEGVEVTPGSSTVAVSNRGTVPRSINREEFELHHDVFSLLFVSEVASVTFFYSLFFFGIQVAILVLIATNLVKDAPEGNPLKVPLSVTADVIAAQALALFISLITQPDVISTLDLIQIGYDPHMQKIFTPATCSKWVLSNFCRFFEGFLSIVVSFIFIVQSTTVLDLFLSFAAVQFVSTVDNIGFELAHKGYMVGNIENVTKKVKKHRFHYWPSLASKWIQRGIFLLTMAALYSGWIVIRTRQANGFFLNQVCQVFDVRFGDQYYDFFVAQPCNTTTVDGCPWKNRTRPLHYGPFSDSYKALRDESNNFVLESGRPVYYQRSHLNGFGDGSPPGKFSYCEQESAWVFSIDGVTKGTTDDCDWLMRSSRATDAYSFHEAPSSEWSIWTGVLERASPFEISCGECEKDVDCNFHGSCIKKQCVCQKPWVGNKCQTCAACTQLTQTVLGSENVEETLRFTRLDDVEVYGRPVYYKNGTSIGTFDSYNYNIENEPGTMEVMFYAGTRFYISIWHGYVSDGMKPSDLEQELRDYFADFHSTWHLDDNENKTLAFYTEVTNNPMPIEVQWNAVKDAPLAIFSNQPSGGPVVVNGLEFRCAIAAEETLCAFASSSRVV